MAIKEIQDDNMETVEIDRESLKKGFLSSLFLSSEEPTITIDRESAGIKTKILAHRKERTSLKEKFEKEMPNLSKQEKIDKTNRLASQIPYWSRLWAYESRPEISKENDDKIYEVPNISYVYLDLRNYTALSEVLTASGKEGEETLAWVINAFWSEIEAISVSDGLREVFFEGDGRLLGGLNIPFSKVEKCCRKIKSAVSTFANNPRIKEVISKVQSKLPTYTFDITIRIGFDEKAFIFTIGNDDCRQVVLRGNDLTEVCYVSPDNKGKISYTNKATEPRKRQNSKFEKIIHSKMNHRVDLKDEQEPAINNYLYNITRYLPNGSFRTLSKEKTDRIHYPVAVIGLKLKNTDCASVIGVEKFKKACHKIYDICQEHGGIIFEPPTPDNAGEKFFIAVGGEHIQTYKEGRAVKIADQILLEMKKQGIPIQCGISADKVCIMDIGQNTAFENGNALDFKKPTRHKQISGNLLNLTARMAFSGENEVNVIQATPSITEKLPEANWKNSCLMIFKGRTVPVRISQFAGFKAEDRLLLPSDPIFTGRNAEIERMTVETKPLIISGSQGCGKTSLIHEYLHRNDLLDRKNIFVARCGFHENEPIRNLVEKMIGIKSTDSAGAKAYKFDTASKSLRESGWQKQEIDSLKTFLNIKWKPDKLSNEQSFSSEYLGPAVAKFVQTLIEQLDENCHIIIEDIHEMNRVNARLLVELIWRLKDEKKSKIICSEIKNGHDEAWDEIEGLTRIHLQRFTDAEKQNFIHKLTEQELGERATLHPEVTDYLNLQSDNNPMFLKEAFLRLSRNDLLMPSSVVYNEWRLNPEINKEKKITLGLDHVLDAIYGFLDLEINDEIRNEKEDILYYCTILEKGITSAKIKEIFDVNLDDESIERLLSDFYERGLLRYDSSRETYQFGAGILIKKVLEGMRIERGITEHVKASRHFMKTEEYIRAHENYVKIQHEMTENKEEFIYSHELVQASWFAAMQYQKAYDTEKVIECYEKIEEILLTDMSLARTIPLDELYFNLGRFYALNFQYEPSETYYNKYENYRKNCRPGTWTFEERHKLTRRFFQIFKRRHFPNDIVEIKARCEEELSLIERERDIPEEIETKAYFYLKNSHLLSQFNLYREKSPNSDPDYYINCQKDLLAEIERKMKERPDLAETLKIERVRIISNFTVYYDFIKCNDLALKYGKRAELLLDELIKTRESIPDDELDLRGGILQSIMRSASYLKDKKTLELYTKKVLNAANTFKLPLIRGLTMLGELTNLDDASMICERKDVIAKKDINCRVYREAVHCRCLDDAGIALANIIQCIHYQNIHFDISQDEKERNKVEIINYLNKFEKIKKEVENIALSYLSKIHKCEMIAVDRTELEEVLWQQMFPQAISPFIAEMGKKYRY